MMVDMEESTFSPWRPGIGRHIAGGMT